MSEPALQVTQQQLSFLTNCNDPSRALPLPEEGVAARGAVFTRRRVVEFMLDLAGYTSNRPLHQQRLLEPSFGDGDFLLPAIGRLLSAWQGANHSSTPLDSLAHCVHAVEVHPSTFDSTRAKVLCLLQAHGISPGGASSLADSWLVLGDFLLMPLNGPFEYVIGNPPYVRQELIPESRLLKYRSLFNTMYDRADIYIPFIEHSLINLTKGGCLAFICSDRWMKNKYGGPLRQLISDRFHLQYYVDMVNTPAFKTDVLAYPAITVIRRERAGKTRIAHRPAINHAELADLSAQLLGTKSPTKEALISEADRVTNGSEPWIFHSFDKLALVRRLERTFPTLEMGGCKVGIGVATGADRAFIGPYDQLDVESDRKLPLVMTRDILSGSIDWRGFGVVNPFADDGSLVNLSEYPLLRLYFEQRKEVIAKRHCAQKNAAKWYRTIDRITPSILSQPKLLIPDIKGEAHIVYDSGQYYPHHNIYYITSDSWDIRALRTVLLSGIARLFVETYSTKMASGYLRFQAQYLRRIRIPHWASIPQDVQEMLIRASEHHGVLSCKEAVFSLYSISHEEAALLQWSDN